MSGNNDRKTIIDNSEDLKDKITESFDDFKLRAELLVANLKEGAMMVTTILSAVQGVKGSDQVKFLN